MPAGTTSIHWMGSQNPPAVRREPGETHVVIPGWVMPVCHGDATVKASGDLLWIPGPSSGPWLALAAALLAATVLVVARFRGARLLAGLVAALVFLDIVHGAGTSFSVAAPTAHQLRRVLSSNWAPPVAWILCGVSIWMLLRGRDRGIGLAFVSAATVALSGGLADLSDLSKSQVPFTMGPRPPDGSWSPRWESASGWP